MGGCVSSHEGSVKGATPQPSPRGATETLPEPWESTIRRGFGAPQRLRPRRCGVRARAPASDSCCAAGILRVCGGDGGADRARVHALQPGRARAVALRRGAGACRPARCAAALDPYAKRAFIPCLCAPQAAEKDEHARLRSYVDRAAAAAQAAVASGTGSGPLRGSPGWRDSDAYPECRVDYGPLRAHAATVAGTRGGGSRPNQDAYGITGAVTLPNAPPLLLASVLDGHGPQGHYISRHVRDRLPAWISSCARDGDEAAMNNDLPPWVQRATAAYGLSYPAAAPPHLARLPGAGGAALPDSLPGWARSAVRAFIELDADLCAGRSQLLSASRVTPESSGCTAVCALLSTEARLCLVAAAGDSAAFLAEELPPSHAPAAGDEGVEPEVAPPGRRPRYAARLLTLAHTPAGDEAQRVRLAGGRVAAHPGEAHIPRVWPREQDVKPAAPAFGLAVSRAFGDAHWKGAGVCAAPDVTLHALRPQDAFLLLCSDGVTDALSGAQAVAAAADALHAAAEAGDGDEAAALNAAAAVNAAAVEAWARRFPRHSRDDITSVVVTLRQLSRRAAAPE